MRDKVPIADRIKPSTKIENSPDKKRRRTLKEVAKLVIIAIRFSKAASYRKEGWIREVHGGVKMWVNQHTGEVSLESPWKLDLSTVKKNTKNLEAIQPTTPEKKSKRLSITQRFSMIFFGSRKQDNNDEKTVKLSLVKEYSHISTTNVTRETSMINNDEIYENNNDNPTSEIEELFKMFDDEMKKKKSLLL
eukprot:CAMPEP_0173155554 /NCGR_PEP_ID=MMETSP1105-20130129/14173_1 /TAXON_ID=2985 /ORGANISM="Ochromonas sp., Strain BG-1" /LENGTH=190 /DNA_ID=CAMNT_0014071999 /DNA_START=170 /DNA_END=742 /DNA_ORIENTATION=-